ncbi:hypothetical protein CFP56_010999 [Quercus suber]|uniref:Uncharacterized protein n=1 Tax=Quercus suber TaxID=58331 RepID=A0AAW0L1A2_QUESU
MAFRGGIYFHLLFGLCGDTETEFPLRIFLVTRGSLPHASIKLKSFSSV